MKTRLTPGIAAIFVLLAIYVLAAILAPTDAGLGQIIVTSPRVPPAVRQALNVEAGLNDGLSVPFMLFFMALAPVAGGAITRTTPAATAATAVDSTREGADRR